MLTKYLVDSSLSIMDLVWWALLLEFISVFPSQMYSKRLVDKFENPINNQSRRHTGFQEQWQWAIMLFSLSYMLFSCMFLLRLMSYHSVVQKMVRHCAQIKTNLQNALLLELPSKSHLEVTIERFSMSSPIRPLDMFDLNASSAMSIFGLLLTYLIVLFQLKVSDNFMPSNGTAMPSSNITYKM